MTMNSDINIGIEEQCVENIDVYKFAADNDLTVLYAEKDAEIKLSTVSVNRPGLILGGFDDYFAKSRIQVMGNAEMYFLYKMDEEKRDFTMNKLFKAEIPCLIICRGLEPCKNMLNIAKQHRCPILQSSKMTSEFVNDLVNYLNELLAPKTMSHGVLLDIAGVGVLLLGKSGIGKSETALELIHRGHMLISDDAVEMKRVKNKIIGRAPERIRDFMEMRGVGIINVRNLYGIAGVLDETQVDLVIELVGQENKSTIARSDVGKMTYNVMGVEIPMLKIPVITGRNLAIIVEVAAKNFRLQQMGFDANEELEQRLMKSFADNKNCR